MLKKFFSMLLAVSMLLTSVGVMAATYEAETIPEVGVIFSDDFEYEMNWWPEMEAEMKAAGYSNAYSWGGVSTADRGKVGQVAGDAAFCAAYTVKDEINSGVLKLSTSYYIPSFTRPDNVNSEYRLYGSTFNSSGNPTYHYTLEVATSWAESPKLVFGEVHHGSYTPPSNGSEFEVEPRDLEFDTWYDVETVIDYEAKTVCYFLNGERVCVMNIAEAAFDTYLPVKIVEIYKANTTLESDIRFYVDDIKIEKLGTDFSATIDGFGENYVDVKFVDDVSEGKTGTIAVKNLADGQNLAVTDISKVTADTLRISTEEEIVSGQMYELEFVSDVKSLYNERAKIASGTKLLFTAKTDKVVKTLLDYDFENNFDLEAAYASKDILFIDASGDFDDGKDTVYEENAYDNIKEKLYTKKDESTNNTYLEFEHNSAQTQFDNIHFSFADDLEVSKGILEIEFDYARAYDDPIYDVNGVALTGHEAMANPSRSYLGFNNKSIADFTKNESCVLTYTVPTSEKANRNATYSQIFIYGANDWYEKWSLYGAREGDIGRLAPTDWGLLYKMIENPNGKFMKVKMVIDLDNNTHKVYVDGELKGENNFIPGNTNDAIYDAFVMGAARYSSWVKEGSYFRLDNIVATNSYTEKYVDNIKFTDYEGNETSFATTAKTGTNKITVELTDEVDAEAFANAISLTGVDAKEITVNGKVATIALENCLTPETTYTLSVSKTAGIANDFSVQFTTDKGEIKFAKPVIYVNDVVMSGTLGTVNAGDTVKAVSNIINTTANDAGYFILLAAYNGDVLTKVALTNSSLSAEGTYRGSAVAEITADADFAAADTVKAFVFNNPTSIIPLTLPEILTK